MRAGAQRNALPPRSKPIPGLASATESGAGFFAGRADGGQSANGIADAADYLALRRVGIQLKPIDAGHTHFPAGVWATGFRGLPERVSTWERLATIQTPPPRIQKETRPFFDLDL